MDHLTRAAVIARADALFDYIDKHCKGEPLADLAKRNVFAVLRWAERSLPRAEIVAMGADASVVEDLARSGLRDALN